MFAEILYSAIIDKNAPKAEIGKPTADGINLRDVALSIASQGKPGDVACVTTNKISGYYITRADGITSVVIAKEYATARTVLLLLKKVDRILAETPHINDSEYQKILESAADDVKNSRDNVQLASGELAQVKQIMIDNIDRLLERGERVNLLVDRTGEMSHSANLFQRQATQLQRKYWFQNVKLCLLGIAVGAASIFAFVKLFLM